MSTGRVVFVGAGPGAPDLITLRGARALAQAEVVLYDALTDQGLQALAPQARWQFVGKRGYQASVQQDVILALLCKHALAGRQVVRLKGGDPSLFGRLEEEMAALQAHGIDYEVVPGVTAALAAAAEARLPLTRRKRGRSVTLLTATTADEDDAQSSTGHPPESNDSLVFYMGAQAVTRLANKLLRDGWDISTPALVVSRAGHADARVSRHTLETLPSARLMHTGRPCIITVGVAATPVELRGLPAPLVPQVTAAVSGAAS